MKNSRKTEKIVLAMAASAALASVVLWWHRDGPAPRRTPVASIPATISTTAAATAPTHAENVAPAAMPAPTALPTAADDRVSAPMPAPVAPPEPARTRAPTSAVAPAEATIGSSGSALESPATQSNGTAESGQETAPSIEEPDAHDDAIDLFAERITKLEQTDSSDPADANDARLLNEFNARAPDGEAAPQRVTVLRNHLNAWLAGFAPERVDHMKLVSVDCRVASCQILIAEQTADVSPQLNESFSASFGSLVSEDWCTDLGLMPQSLAMHASGSGTDGKSDHALWTIYLAAVTAG
ncbi:MAG: hypothetical protein ABIO49_15955 [Dokdonella sp.]